MKQSLAVICLIVGIVNVAYSQSLHELATRDAVWMWQLNNNQTFERCSGVVTGYYRACFDAAQVQRCSSGALYVCRTNGQVLWEFSITNGAFNGKAVGWGDGGRKEMQGNYVDGVPFGVWTTWDGAGNKKEEYRTRGSTRSGFAVEWHSNGVLSSVTWVDGEKRVHVPCVTWSEEGIRLYENDVEVKEKERERSNQGARGGRGTRPASNE